MEEPGLQAVFTGGYETYITNRNGETYVTFVFSEPKPKTWRDRLKALGKYYRIKKDDELLKKEESCCICLQKYKPGEYKRDLSCCGQTFHKKCIDKWLRKSRNMSCPLCRHDYSQF